MQGSSAFGWLGIGTIAGLVGMPMALAVSGSVVALGGSTGLHGRRAGGTGEGFP